MPEVAVVGGGAVGLTAAALLARSGVEVALIERKELPPAAPGPEPDLRVLALTPASEAILEACGAWQNMDLSRVAPWTRMKVWEHADQDGIEFLDSDVNEPRLGHIVENANLIRALHQALMEQGVELHCPDAVARIAPHGEGVCLDLESGTQLDARLAIAADGSSSSVRKLAGLEWDSWPYQEQAVVAEIETEIPGEHTAWQRFVPGGPVALLPLFNGHHSLVWSTERADALTAMEPEEFEEALAAALGGRLGATRLRGPRQQFSLMRGLAPRWCDGRVALAGDAAHVVHPLAGLGQNLGMMDAAVLQEELAAHPFSPRALRAYERRRKGPVLAAQWTLEAFRLGFGRAGPLLRHAGGLGLELAGRSRALRKLFIEQANCCLDGPQWLRAGEEFPAKK